MQCPVCALPLIAVEREQIEVDLCISCHGLWFDRGELELLCEKTNVTLDMPRLFVAATAVEKTRKCPRCDKNMSKVALAANTRLVTDHCPDEHGIWFDSQELGSVLDTAAEASTPVVRFLGEVFGKK